MTLATNLAHGYNICRHRGACAIFILPVVVLLSSQLCQNELKCAQTIPASALTTPPPPPPPPKKKHEIAHLNMETSAPKAILASPYTPPSLMGEALWKQHISKKKVPYLTLSVMLPLWTVVKISSFQKNIQSI